MSAVLAPVEERLTIISPHEIAAMWHRIAKDVEGALLSGCGEVTAEDTKAGLIAGRTRLLLMNSPTGHLGLVFTSIVYPRYKVARVVVAFGRGMNGLREPMEEAEAWAKANGFKFVEAWVSSAGRERLFARYGYHPVYKIIRKPL